MTREPPHFTRDDFIRAFFGSFIVGLAFIFNGMLVTYATRMNENQVVAVVVLACLIVSCEIYLLGYKFVNDRKHRPFLEFWAKRFFSITAASFASMYFICLIYGIDKFVGSPLELFKVVVAVFLPAATTGGAVEILKKRIF